MPPGRHRRDRVVRIRARASVLRGSRRGLRPGPGRRSRGRRPGLCRAAPGCHRELVRRAGPCSAWPPNEAMVPPMSGAVAGPVLAHRQRRTFALRAAVERRHALPPASGVGPALGHRSHCGWADPLARASSGVLFWVGAATTRSKARCRASTAAGSWMRTAILNSGYFPTTPS